jgi:hypothetical protein
MGRAKSTPRERESPLCKSVSRPRRQPVTQPLCDNAEIDFFGRPPDFAPTHRDIWDICPNARARRPEKEVGTWQNRTMPLLLYFPAFVPRAIFGRSSGGRLMTFREKLVDQSRSLGLLYARFFGQKM